MRRDAATDKPIPTDSVSARRVLRQLPRIKLGKYKRLSSTALNTLLMEPTCSKDEQRIQLLSAEDSESNSPEIRLQRPQVCLHRYCKILVITPLLVALLLLTYWITTQGGGRQSSSSSYLNQSVHTPVNHTVASGNHDLPVDVKREPYGCLVGLYTLAKMQMNEFEQSGASETTVYSADIRHNAELLTVNENPGQSITAEILVHESPVNAKGGSSFLAFVGGDHSTAVGFFTDNRNGTYSVCCPIPPECVNITIRLFSYNYSAYRAITGLWTNASDEIGIRTVYQTRFCPSQASMNAGMTHIPPMCTRHATSMKPGSWTQINTQWFWKSHEENCLVPDMSNEWTTCASKTYEMQFFGDITSHWYAFYMKEFVKSLPQDALHSLSEPKHTFAFTCKDIHTHLFGIQTVPNKLTYVVIHCGSNTFFEKGFTALQNEISDLFEKIQEVKQISPNLRFVFILSTLKQQFSKSHASQYSELNLFSSAAINSWIADKAGTNGISVFDDMYPKTMGLAHIGIIDRPLANLLMYQMCNIN